MTGARRTQACTAAIVVCAAALLAGAPLAPAQQNEQLERKRLELDIERLQREARPWAGLQRWLPAFSAVVAFAAAGYGAWRYFDERKRADDSRIEEGITHSLERLTEPPSDASPNARAITALRALVAHADASASAKASKRRSDITHAVTAVVHDDVSVFETRHEARLPVICLDHWPDFQTVAAENRQLCRDVLNRYAQALDAMKGRAPVYVPRVERQDGGGYTAAGPLSPPDALLFPALVTGFERYLAFLPAGEDRDEAVQRFSSSAEKLGRQLFGAQQP